MNVSSPGDDPEDETADYLHMVRDLPSTPEAIYTAWTDLARITSWWGPEGFLVPPDRVISHKHVGGEYRACLINAVTGDEFWWGGEYLILAPPLQLRLTQRWEEEDGTPTGPQTVIDVGMQSLPDRTQPVTRMTFRQGPFTGDRELVDYEGRWNASFSRLAGYLARHRGPD